MILADFRARIVHEPDTHEDPRRLVRHVRLTGILARLSLRDARMCTCTRLAIVYTFTKLLHDRRIPNVGVGVRVSVSVPWNSSFNQLLELCVILSL